MSIGQSYRGRFCKYRSVSVPAKLIYPDSGKSASESLITYRCGLLFFEAGILPGKED